MGFTPAAHDHVQHIVGKFHIFFRRFFEPGFFKLVGFFQNAVFQDAGKCVEIGGNLTGRRRCRISRHNTFDAINIQGVISDISQFEDKLGRPARNPGRRV
jgi:hypothetical protein